jgi:hypothetical protein
MVIGKAWAQGFGGDSGRGVTSVGGKLLYRPLATGKGGMLLFYRLAKALPKCGEGRQNRIEAAFGDHQRLSYVFLGIKAALCCVEPEVLNAFKSFHAWAVCIFSVSSTSFLRVVT